MLTGAVIRTGRVHQVNLKNTCVLNVLITLKYSNLAAWLMICHYII